MRSNMTLKVACGALAGIVFAAAYVSSAAAFGDAPKPTIDCRKKKNKSRPECANPQHPGGQNQSENRAGGAERALSLRSVDAVYSAAYVLAQRGEFA